MLKKKRRAFFFHPEELFFFIFYELSGTYSKNSAVQQTKWWLLKQTAL